ncbi:MAG: alpha-L-fucosidase [Candidatus Methanomethylicus sp.]|nr:alpha-L-fucosidase [Candidatus Methanomethylicus sp.]
MKLRNRFSIITLACTLAFSAATESSAQPLAPLKVVPSIEQQAYQQLETIGFIHFSINTFTGKEWGYGDESPALFNPTALNAEQWVIAAKEGGLKELILTTKHHDGFCLWPSAFTEHSVKNSPYKNGKGDVVREFVDACHKHGLKVGFYLSPWDRNHADYGKPEYITYYKNQLTELLTQYGKVDEMWFDGANGGDGYYGGARESRTIDRETYYQWESIFSLVKKLQPGILIFSDAGPDIRWVGNEHGYAGETFWSTIDKSKLVIGASDSDYLNVGDPNGNAWLIGQCDVSIRPGWFYHPEQDSLVKSPLQLVDLYYKSVGRNGVLLLNLPPDKRGLIHETDVASLKAYKSIIDSTFHTNLALGKVASISMDKSNYRFAARDVTDGKSSTNWYPPVDKETEDVVLDLGAEFAFDRIMLQEPVFLGQRISHFILYVQEADEEWREIAAGTTIGYKRLLRINEERARFIKIIFSAEGIKPALSEIGIFHSADAEK